MYDSRRRHRCRVQFFRDDHRKSAFRFDVLFVFLMIGLVLRLVMIRSRVFFCECISGLFLFPWVEKSSWGNVQGILCRYFFLFSGGFYSESFCLCR